MKQIDLLICTDYSISLGMNCAAKRLMPQKSTISSARLWTTRRLSYLLDETG